ncbi:MAG: arginine--tRNA ligase, partial [Bifidobacteriaceae bacterium]|nr:arginine--tRNA ligase [Bifidobacteriaceae bacterium]
MTPEELSQALVQALNQAIDEGQLPLDPADLPATVLVERPRQREHGDWATNVALQLAKRAGLKPRDLAQLLAQRLEQNPAIAKAEVAGPGFLNLTLSPAAAGNLAREIVQAGAAYGEGTAAQGQTINLEFVSANPTGPVHLAGGRWAAVGDAIARVLVAQGAQVV